MVEFELMVTSFLVEASASIPNGSIMRSLNAWRRQNALKDFGLLPSPRITLSSVESSSNPKRSVSHLDQFPIYKTVNRIKNLKLTARKFCTF